MPRSRVSPTKTKKIAIKVKVKCHELQAHQAPGTNVLPGGQSAALN